MHILVYRYRAFCFGIIINFLLRLIVITPHSRTDSSSRSLLRNLRQRPHFQIENVPEHFEIVLEIRRCFDECHALSDGVGQAGEQSVSKGSLLYFREKVIR